jgi:hypothetical protein
MFCDEHRKCDKKNVWKMFSHLLDFLNTLDVSEIEISEHRPRFESTHVLLEHFFSIASRIELPARRCGAEQGERAESIIRQIIMGYRGRDIHASLVPIAPNPKQPDTAAEADLPSPIGQEEGSIQYTAISDNQPSPSRDSPQKQHRPRMSLAPTNLPWPVSQRNTNPRSNCFARFCSRPGQLALPSLP